MAKNAQRPRVAVIGTFAMLFRPRDAELEVPRTEKKDKDAVLRFNRHRGFFVYRRASTIGDGKNHSGVVVESVGC
jgi:hypothetical protein